MYDEDLANLDEWLRRLKVEYDIFFNGNRKKPPDDLRMRVEKLSKKLSEAADMTFSQRFHYNTLTARFYVYRDRWRRIMKARELGAGVKDEAYPGAEIPSPSTQAELAEQGIRISIVDPEVEPEKVKRLYGALLRIRHRRAQGSPSISYEQFAKYLATQTRVIQAKYGCASVLFTVSLEKDAIRFTATAEGQR